MSDDLVALKILIVSDSASERAALRDAAAAASVIVEVAEIDRIGDAPEVCRALTDGNVDAVFVDSRMAQEARRAVLKAARETQPQPLVISVGVAESTSHYAPEGFPVDGSLAKPIDRGQALALFDSCLRARLPIRVLVVDDSATVRSVIRKVLQSCRYRLDVEEAVDGRAALEAAGRQRFDVVLLDCQMAGLDGFETLAAFRHNHADAKIVMLTATNDTRSAERARAAGAHEVLYKPFYAKDVDMAMNRLLGMPGPRARA